MRWMTLIVILWTGTAAAETPKVVADIPPVHSLVARVMAGIGEPALLLDGTASPHGGSLRPSQARALAGADLVIWMGDALSPWLEDAIRRNGLALLEAEGTHRLEMREGGVLHDGHDHGHEHDHHDAIDPHAWLDPANGRLWLDIIAAALSDIDPENADRYAANAAAGRQELEALEARIAARLTPLQGQSIAVIHDAFHYFEDRFGLTTVAALIAGDGDKPGPRRIQAIRKRLSAGGVTCLIAEPGGSMPERFVSGTEITVQRIDPLGARIEIGEGLYPALLQDIADGIITCLGKAPS